ncbi:MULTISPECIES: RraA family protein [Lactococcus]|uniref:RraA family protein n=2 Tax=Streptococcaceae TaxID=1300 RepID=UPI00203D6530|nr:MULTISPECIES: RraA family protein [Lactococcus]
MENLTSRKLKSLSSIFNSSIFSDIMDDMGYKNQMIAGLHPNIEGAKSFGRANTLKIRKLKEGEDFRGIYAALDTYKSVNEGDIIIVENEVFDRAYFGELNANLAIRSGAIASIIGGVTRDAKEVKDLGYPVFAVGYFAQDVRGRATLEGHNVPITINGVSIKPKDLIFADINGVAIIPQEIEEKVVTRAIEVIQTEKNIIDKITLGVDAMTIYDEEGAF